jgi:hypothetical protein
MREKGLRPEYSAAAMKQLSSLHVDALVAQNTPIDLDASVNTTSVYTPGKIFSISYAGSTFPLSVEPIAKLIRPAKSPF